MTVNLSEKTMTWQEALAATAVVSWNGLRDAARHPSRWFLVAVVGRRNR